MKEDGGLEPDTETSDFLWEVHRYTNEYIRFADTKAAFIAGASTALIGALVVSPLFDSCFRTTPSSWSSLQWVGGLGLMLLATSLVLSIGAIGPRLWNQTKVGFIYWRSIAGHGTAQEFTREVRELSARDRVVAISEHLFVLADIAQGKYACVDWALIVGILGGALAGIVFFIQHGMK